MESRHQEIGALLADPARKEIIEKYTVYFPFKFKRTTTEGMKIAIEKISYWDTRDALEFAFNITKQLQAEIVDFTLPKEIKKASEKEKKFKLFVKTAKEHFEAALNSKKPDIGKLYTAFLLDSKWLEELISVINLIADACKKSELDKKLTRFAVAVEGCFLNIGINYTRKEALSIFNESSDECEHPVKERKTKVTKGESKALFFVAKMDTIQSIPLILATMSELLRIINDDERRRSTIQAINYAFKILFDAHALLNKSITDQVSAVVGKLNTIDAELQTLVDKVKEIQLSADILPQCQELSFLLGALYLHTYKDKDNLLPDPENVALKTASVGRLSKIKIAKYYEDAALILGELTRDPTKFQDFSPIALLVDAPVPESAPIPIPEKEVSLPLDENTTTLPEAPEVVIQSPQLVVDNTERMLELPEKKSPEGDLLLVDQSAGGIEQVKFLDAEIAALLAAQKESRSQLRITILAHCINEMYRISKPLENQLNAYLFVNRCHKVVANSQDSPLDYTPSLFTSYERLLPDEIEEKERSEGIKQHILKLLDSWKLAANKTGVQKFLDDICTIFCLQGLSLHGENLSSLLMLYREGSPELRISMLAAHIDQFPLEMELVAKIDTYIEMNQCYANVKKIQSAWFTASWMPTVFGRRHSAGLDQAVASMDSAKHLPISEKVKHYLIALVKLWRETAHENSREVNPLVQEILIDICDLVKRSQLDASVDFEKSVAASWSAKRR